LIDFRYHLVSIVGVFLALAIGLVLGSTTLKPSVQAALERTAAQEHQQIDQLIASGKLSRSQLAADEQFAQVLDGRRVVLVTAPGAPGAVTNGVSTALTQAGAVISGQVQMRAEFFDPSASTQQALSQVAQQAAAATTLPTGSAVVQAGRVLAGAILTRGDPGQPTAGQPDPAAKNIVQSMASAGFLTAVGEPWSRATLAVVVIPASPPSQNDSNPASQRLVTLAQQLNLAGHGTVVAGSVGGSLAGSAIDVLRSGGESFRFSSVDNADMITGQIAVAQALQQSLRGGFGSYGITGPDGPAPTPLPVPSGSASPAAASRTARATPTPTATGRH
jgi:Copper transport outer membrane protein, MctB